MVQKYLGIIGGMGPRVLILFCNKIINNKVINKEQDHIPFIAISDPTIEDRSNAIINGTTSNILIKLNKLIDGLVCNNITHLIMLCNTIHYWIPQLKYYNIEILNIIQLTKNYIDLNFQYNKLLLLATKGTYQTKIYYDYFDENKLIIPNNEYKNKLMNIIYECKIGNDNIKELIHLIIQLKKKYNFNGIILGCTELSILFENYKQVCNIIIFDPISISANYIVHLS